jgi:hypothetical protein
LLFNEATEEKEGRLAFTILKPSVCQVVEKNIIQVYKIVFDVREKTARSV